MSALRKAGVWLGLIEDDEDRGYGYDDRSYDDDYPDDEFADAGTVVRNRVADRLAEQRAERTSSFDRGRPASRGTRDSSVRESSVRGVASDLDEDDEEHGSSVRQLARPAATVTDAGAPRMRDSDTSYPTQDNLALAPQVRPEVRPVAAVVPHVVPAAVPDERRYQITTLHPMTFNDARTIGEHFRDGVPVILNLTEMAESDAKRLVDFAAGLAFGLRGTMERVTNRVFLLSPANVQVTAEDKAKIAEGGFFYQ